MLSLDNQFGSCAEKSSTQALIVCCFQLVLVSLAALTWLDTRRDLEAGVAYTLYTLQFLLCGVETVSL